MKYYYDKLIALLILGTFICTTGLAIHNLLEIQVSLDRANQLLQQNVSDQDLYLEESKVIFDPVRQ